MTATGASPRPTSLYAERGSFGAVVRAEWTKFRTVRGWLIGLVLAALLCVVFTYVVANGNHTGSCTGTGISCQSGHPLVPTGPDGEAVADSYQYFEQPLTGDGTLTVRITSLTGLLSTNPPGVAPSIAASRPGLAGWAKAGVLLTPTTKQGAPYAAVMATGGNTASDTLPFGIVVALMVLIVVATMFITAEYRRGLIRTTFAATPQRGAVLAAKALVIGTVAFAVGALAAAVAVPLGIHVLGSGGNYVFPANALTLARVVAGTGALAAVTAVGVLGLGAAVRTSAEAVTAGIVVFALPSLIGPGVLGPAASGGMAWLYRFTPAAACSVFGVLPRSSLVDFPYTLANGYNPLAAWAGLAVLCLYAAAAVALAAYLLRRRDA